MLFGKKHTIDNRQILSQINFILKNIVFIEALLYIVSYLTIAILRIRYPYELEWMEGSSLNTIYRIREGLSIYTRPSIEYIPNIYPPLYYYIASLFSFIFGINLFSLRLVSFIASILCLVLIFIIVYRESREKYIAFIAAGLYAAVYKISGGWFDIARVDSLSVFLLLQHIYIIRYSRLKHNHIVAGLIFTLCLFTKQSAIFFLPFILLYYLIFLKKNFLQFFFSFFLSTTVFFGIYDNVTNHWFSYSIFMPRNATFLISMFYSFWLNDLLKNLMIVCPIVIIGVALCLLKKGKKEVLSYTLMYGGFVFISWAGRIKKGGEINDLIPVYAALCILYGVSISIIKKTFHNNGAILVSIVTLLQLTLLFYNPLDHVPTHEDKLFGDRLVQKIKKVNGPVLLPYSNYLTHYAGKHNNFHIVGLFELRGIFGGKITREGIEVQKNMDKEVENHKFSMIILNNDPLLPSFYPEINKYYVLKQVFTNDKSFYPKTGWKTRVKYVFVPSGL